MRAFRTTRQLWSGALKSSAAAVAVLVLAAPLAVAQGLPGYQFKGAVWHPEAVPGTPAVGSHQLTAPAQQRAGTKQPLTDYQAASPVWPAAGTGTVALTARTAPVRAGKLPVWVSATAPRAGTHPAASPDSVRVRVASHQQTLAAGANGLLLGLNPAAGQSSGGPVQVAVDYSALARAYGGGYGSRLQLYQVPACALTTPQLAACRTRTPLAATNHADTQQLTAAVTLAAAGAAVEATSGAAGSQGDYSASPLLPSGTWQTTGTGAYTYGYPLAVPTAVGGNAPTVGLDYDSQTADGETSARNSQTSALGESWSYQPGLVERSYRSCGSLLDSDGKKLLKGSGDDCWSSDNATLSFGSHSGTLVPVAATISDPDLVQQWVLQGDDGTIVQELKGAGNGLQDGIYYRALMTDGSAAYFGADHAPTGAGVNGAQQSSPADPSTDAAWGVPVLHPQSGDPCYDSAKGKASQCAKPEGWRWNLDFVVSPTGFVQRYDYSTETNYYALGGGQAATGSFGKLTAYTRSGSLTSISYGYQLTDEIAGRSPAAQVVFSNKQRCQQDSSFDCSAAISDSNATHWPDVPWDLDCDSSDTTTVPTGATTVPANVCVTASPTFWSTSRLDSVTTKVYVAGTGLTKVDSYQLTQVYSDAGGAVDPVTKGTVDPADAGALQAVMWLQSIQHTGYDPAGNAITLNPVTFGGTEIDNRVDDSSPSAPPLYRPRISQVQTETGGDISVVYNLDPCAGLTLTAADADSDTHSCYPSYWTVPGESKPILDWFNKTTVHQVTASDQTVAALYKPDAQQLAVGSEAQVSLYSYSGPAWHRDDSAQTDDQYRTWDQFRGFRTVTVRTGSAPEPITQQTTTYLQGMDGDYKADGSRRSVSVSDNFGDTVTDSDWLSGTTLETDTYTKAGGTLAGADTLPAVSDTGTASAARTAWSDWTQDDNPGQTKPALSTLPPLTAHRPSSMTSHSYDLLKDGQTWRQQTSTTGYDAQGRVSTEDSSAVDAKLGVTATPLQEKCSTTTYATPPAANPRMLSYPDQITSVNGGCAAATPANLLSDTQNYYGGDGTLSALGTFGQVDATGRVTGTRVATGWSGSTEQWRATAGTVYDGAGRVSRSASPDPTGAQPAGLFTSSAYTPAWSTAGGNTNTRSIKTTNSQTWSTTTTLDPLRGLTTESVDVNKRKSDISYDALGRRTAVWMPGRSQATQTANQTFSYSVDPGVVRAADGTLTNPGLPSAITTRTLREDGSYDSSVSIYDGLMQPRQTQTSATGDSNTGRLIADTFYDSHGWQAATYDAYSEPTGQPSTTLYPANENQIPAETTTEFDGQGRPLRSTLWHDAVQQWQTSTSYPGADETDTVPPVGGSATQAFTNALGQTVKSVLKNTNQPVALTGGGFLPSGSSLMSDSVRLAMQADGNLVLSSLITGKALWSSGTSGNPGAAATFRTDGNLSVATPTGTVLWTSGLTAVSGAVLTLQDDGNLVTRSSGGAVLWSSGTSGQSAADATTTYSYYPSGSVHTVGDSAGNQWSYSYDLLGEKTQQTDPNTGTTTFDRYDALGDVQQSTDPRGQKLSYSYDWSGRKTAEYSGAWSATPDATKELAAWAYDQAPSTADSPNPNAATLGYPSSSTRYVNGATGSTSKAYLQAVSGYTTGYQPTGSTLTVPAADGFAAAGQTTAPTSGTVTYQTGADYTAVTGELSHSYFSADGGLPSETISYGYNQQGDLTGFGGFISPTKTPSYLDDTTHDAFGRILQATYGPSGTQLATFAQYDATTGRTTQTSTMAQPSTTALDVVNYRYDQSGQLTAIDDLQNNTTHDTQCFSYDSLQRLTQAWTETWSGTANLTNSGTAQPDLSSAAVGAVGGCTSSTPETQTNGVPTSTVGGPAPYWQTYSYDLLGDRTGMVSHDTGGNALKDTTQAVAFSGADASAPAATPDQGSTATTGSPAKGTVTQTATHTDTGYTPNQNAGNTMSRKVATTGPVSSAFTPTGGGTLCVDDATGSTTPGNKVQAYTCNASTSQLLTIGTDATIQVRGLCLDTTGQASTTGTKIVINTCDSTKATQQWKAGRNGSFVSAANTALCLTDPAAAASGTQLTIATCGSTGQSWATPATTTAAGAVPAGRTQNLSYDPEGRTSQVSTGDGNNTQTSKYLYNADGTLLEETTATGSTDISRVLYLFGGAEQITLTVGSKSWTALRNYTGPDGTTITRTSAGGLTYQVSNAQGTALTAINAATLVATRRAYDPYGNPRGTQPGSWISADENHGFLGQPTDTNTGLDLLGARDYDPVQGRFLQRDPVFEAGNPNQMGGYGYAGDSPVSKADPTGMCPREVCPAQDTGSTADSGGWCTCQCQGTCGSGASSSGTPSNGTTATPPGTGLPGKYGNKTTRHDQARDAAIVEIKAQAAKMGVKDLQILTSMRVTGASKKCMRPGKNPASDCSYGVPDIVGYDPKNHVYYVWEVKSAGEAAKAEPEAQWYANRMRANGMNTVVGWTIGGPYVVGNGDEVIGPVPGAIIYGRPNQKKYQKVLSSAPMAVAQQSHPIPTPLPGPAPGPYPGTAYQPGLGVVPLASDGVGMGPLLIPMVVIGVPALVITCIEACTAAAASGAAVTATVAVTQSMFALAGPGE